MYEEKAKIMVETSVHQSCDVAITLSPNCNHIYIHI